MTEECLAVVVIMKHECQKHQGKCMFCEFGQYKTEKNKSKWSCILKQAGQPKDWADD